MSLLPTPSVVKGSLVKVDSAGKRRKVLVIRPADGSHDDIAAIGCSEGELIALLSGAGHKVFPVSRLIIVS